MRPILSFTALLAFAWALAAQLGNSSPLDLQIPIRGKLAIDNDGSLLHRIDGKDVHLTSKDPSIRASLGDLRLEGRELKIIGEWLDANTFEAHEFFIIRDGVPYRLIYFCNVCNITTFSPGDCMCCQAPTQPVEVLPTDPRIYHEDSDSRPKPKPPE